MQSSPSFGAQTDEELVAVAKNSGGQPAFELLAVRYRPWLEHWAAHLCQTRQLKPEDRQDAQQQVFFAFSEAVRTFDPACTRAGQEHPFEVFLFQVARRRLSNFARVLDRVRKQSGQSLDTVPGLDSRACQLPGLLGCDKPSSRVGQDPALIAEENEEAQRLAAALEQLTERQRHVYEAIRDRVPLRTIAEQFGVSYATAWKWQQQIIAILREAVRDKSARE